MDTFGMATHTFTILRRARKSTDANGMPVLNTTQSTIRTGVPIFIRPAMQGIDLADSGIEALSRFIGTADTGLPIMVGDILQDENDTNPDGKSKQYKVTGAYDYGSDFQLPSMMLNLVFIAINNRA